VDTAKGISGLVLLPAKDYGWELKGKCTIEVPLRGKISDLLAAQDAPEGFSMGGDDEFSIFEDNVFLIWELVRVLFAESKYPSLEPDECFNVVALDVDAGKLTVHGEIIKAIGA
jgi:hypothetical protein